MIENDLEEITFIWQTLINQIDDKLMELQRKEIQKISAYIKILNFTNSK